MCFECKCSGIVIKAGLMCPFFILNCFTIIIWWWFVSTIENHSTNRERFIVSIWISIHLFIYQCNLILFTHLSFNFKFASAQYKIESSPFFSVDTYIFCLFIISHHILLKWLWKQINCFTNYCLRSALNTYTKASQCTTIFYDIELRAVQRIHILFLDFE